jgi:hypothetical protein
MYLAIFLPGFHRQMLTTIYPTLGSTALPGFMELVGLSPVPTGQDLVVSSLVNMAFNKRGFLEVSYLLPVPTRISVIIPVMAE